MPISSVNPVTADVLKTFSELTATEVEGILEVAARAQREWAKTALEERAPMMRKLGQLLRQRERELSVLMAQEMGKPIKDGAAEIEKCAWVCDHYAEHSARYLRPRNEPSDAKRSYVRYDPLGVILAVMPWNFPYWQVFRFIAPNLMAGNGGVLKHASNVPQCALSIEELVKDAGFPQHLFRTLLVEPRGVAAIISDERVAGVTLTGSEGAGRSVGEHAGRSLKPVVLELGGSDAFIVLKDADVDEAAKVAAAARCINSGQSCIAAKRFIVEAPIHDRFLAKMSEAMGRFKVGDPMDASTDIGPQARLELRDGLHQQVSEAIAQGARAVLGCEVPKGKGAYYPPSILAEVKPDNVAAREELFGPVAAVMRAKDADDAIALANNSKFGLGAALWTKDTGRAEALAARIEVGTVVVNGMVRSDPRLPFGGVKASGVGRELSEEGARAFTNVKAIQVRT